MAGKKQAQQRWYLGGMGACMAVCFTHPLDTIKVHLQTQTEKKPIRQVVASTLRTNGLRGIYSGLSASIMRQGTYTTTRFGFYEVARARLQGEDGKLSFSLKVLLAAGGGAIGILAGNPADVVNVRMQNDMRLPVEQRLGYRNVIHGLYRVVSSEGPLALFRGLQANIPRSMMINVGQVACYDQAKQTVMGLGMGDNMATHFLSSFIAGTVATALTQPVDVMKTRLMQGTQYNSIFTVFSAILRTEGPMAFYKGFVPAWVRLSPQTILTWLFLERLRIIFPPPTTV